MLNGRVVAAKMEKAKAWKGGQSLGDSNYRPDSSRLAVLALVYVLFGTVGSL